MNNQFPTFNWGIIAHVDHGKTTLTDNLMQGVNLMTKENVGSCFLDYRYDEIERSITMKCSVVPCLFDTNVTSTLYGRFKENFVASKLNEKEKSYIKFNIVDSPGHIDFINEVNYTTKCTDGCVVVIDIVERLQSQTINVIKLALQNDLKLILLINKMDRVLFDLNMDTSEVYRICKNLIEEVNDTIMSLLKENDKAELYDSIYFDPKKNNVIFGSSLKGWGFNMKYFSLMIAQKLGFKNKKEFCNYSFLNYGIVDKKLKCLDNINGGKPIFVEILDRIVKFHKIANNYLQLQKDQRNLNNEDKNPIKDKEDLINDPFFSKLNLNVQSVKEILNTKSDIYKKLFSYWLPLNVFMFDAMAEINNNSVANHSQTLDYMPLIKHTLFNNKDIQTVKTKGLTLCSLFKSVALINNTDVIYCNKNSTISNNTVTEAVIDADFDNNNLPLNDYKLYIQFGNSLLPTKSVSKNDLFYIQHERLLGNISANIDQSQQASSGSSNNFSKTSISLEKECKYLNTDLIESKLMEPLYTVIIIPADINDYTNIKDILCILKKVDGSFEYGISNYTGELFLNTYGMIHLDKIKYDLKYVYLETFNKELDFKISKPRFKFKEHVQNKYHDKNNIYQSDKLDFKIEMKCFNIDIDFVNSWQNNWSITDIKNQLIEFYDDSLKKEENKKILSFLNGISVENLYCGPEKAFNNLLLLNSIESPELKYKIQQAFHQICLHGPIVMENLMGVFFVIEKYEYDMTQKEDKDVSEGHADKSNLTNKDVNENCSPDISIKEHSPTKETIVLDSKICEKVLNSDRSMSNTNKNTNSISSGNGKDPIQVLDETLLSAFPLSSISNANVESTAHTFHSNQVSLMDSLTKFAKSCMTNAFNESNPQIIEAYCKAEILLPEQYINIIYEVATKNKGVITEMEYYSELYFNACASVPLKDSITFSEEVKNRTSGKVTPLVQFDCWKVVDGLALKWQKDEEYLEEWGDTEKHSDAMQLVKYIVKSKNMRMKELIVEEGTKQRTFTRNK